MTLPARGDARTKTAASVLPAAPIAQLVLAPIDDDDLGPGDRRAPPCEAHAAQFPAVDDEHDLVVLSTVGRVAAQRRQMIAGGGPYTRMVELADPAFAPIVTIGTTSSTGGSALDRTIIKRLLNDQLQPHAYSCYARSLGRMIALAGTATFEIELGRGEVTRVTVTGFEDNAEFHACLVDAAYGLAPPMPTPGYNIDDRSSVNYPLTFSVRDQQARRSRRPMRRSRPPRSIARRWPAAEARCRRHQHAARQREAQQGRLQKYEKLRCPSPRLRTADEGRLQGNGSDSFGRPVAGFCYRPFRPSCFHER